MGGACGPGSLFGFTSFFWRRLGSFRSVWWFFSSSSSYASHDLDVLLALISSCQLETIHGRCSLLRRKSFVPFVFFFLLFRFHSLSLSLHALILECAYDQPFAYSSKIKQLLRAQTHAAPPLHCPGRAHTAQPSLVPCWQNPSPPGQRAATF